MQNRNSKVENGTSASLEQNGLLSAADIEKQILNLKMSKMENKIEMFAENMEIELMANKHKGDWNEWDNIEEMIAELEWHKAKLLLALRENNKTLVREYLADCGNILMFIGNAGHIFDGNEKYINRYRNGEIIYNGSKMFNRRETAENYGNTCAKSIYVDTINAAELKDVSSR